MLQQWDLHVLDQGEGGGRMEVLEHRTVAVAQRQIMLCLHEVVVPGAGVSHVVHRSSEDDGQQVNIREVPGHVLLRSHLRPEVVGCRDNLRSVHPVVVGVRPVRGLDCTSQLAGLFNSRLGEGTQVPGAPNAHEHLRQRLLRLPLQPEHIDGQPRVHVDPRRAKIQLRPDASKTVAPALLLPAAHDAALQLDLLDDVLQAGGPRLRAQKMVHPLLILTGWLGGPGIRR
mmetsp:Transcript_11490/g.29728  ORF Transcript_11490/g.29728 Transcript_11490/m.29728 type:complete len:228 (+) Transcript_11490:750-1433(+)